MFLSVEVNCAKKHLATLVESPGACLSIEAVTVTRRQSCQYRSLFVYLHIYYYQSYQFFDFFLEIPNTYI
jgi:hypothetical protein